MLEALCSAAAADGEEYPKNNRCGGETDENEYSGYSARVTEEAF